MDFEVLGFAGAAPLQGACSSYVVASDDTTILLDCGPGTLERLWQRRLLDRVDAIVISHMHADHVLDLLPFAGELVQRLVTKRVALHVPEGAGEVLRRLDRAFTPNGSGLSRFDTAFAIREYRADSTLGIGGLTLTFAATAHPQPCFAMRITGGRHTAVLVGRAQTNCAQRRLYPRSGCVRLARSSSVASVEAANDGSVRLLGWRSMPRVRCRRLRGPDAYPVAL